MKPEIDQIGKNVYTHFELLQDALKKAKDAGFEVRSANRNILGDGEVILPEKIVVSMTSMEVVERRKSILDRATDQNQDWERP